MFQINIQDNFLTPWTVPKCTTVKEAEEMRREARKVLADKILAKDIEKKKRRQAKHQRRMAKNKKKLNCFGQ